MSGNVRTLPEVAEHFRQSEKFIRGLASSRKVPCLRGARGAYLFTDEHVAEIERHLTQEPASQQPLVSARRRRTA